MYRFTYTRGKWTDGIDLPEWKDNEEFSDYIERIEYQSSKLNIGSQHGPQIEVYESSTHNSFYASICPMGGTCYEVLISDFPSLMMFVKEYGPAFSTLNIEGSQQEILELLEKTFRVYHGHAAHEMCQECDPQGWEAAVKSREERSKQ